MPGSPTYSSAARHQAQAILSKPPFATTPDRTPRPLAGVLDAIGRGLEWLFARPARWLYHHLLVHIGHGFHVAFGNWWPVALGVLALGTGVVVGLLLVRRRARISARTAPTRGIDRQGEDPDELERRALGAEEAGDHEAAVRLRFRSGLLRLARQGVITNQDAQTDRQLSVRLQSPTFDTLAVRHEVIVYGRDPATEDDVAAARHDWPRALAEARSASDDAVGAGAPSS